jgi:putative transposase
MPRPVRINLPNLIYHVVNRGNNRQVVFAEESDYHKYLDILRRYKAEFGFKVFAYCLMSNHIHLLLKTSEKGGISAIMKAVTIAHTRNYHFKYNCSGHIWTGRFKSPIVSDDEYLLTVMRYIEQNPVRAGMVNHPGEYAYSSYGSNVKKDADNFIDKEENLIFPRKSGHNEELVLA